MPLMLSFSAAISAQRLSASKGKSHLDGNLNQRTIQCSTPVGIEGEITSSRSESFPAGLVLNACRHRRGNHVKVVELLGGIPAGAQRLSASKGKSRARSRAIESVAA